MLVANELHRKGLAQTLEALALAEDRTMSLHVVGKAGLGPSDRSSSGSASPAGSTTTGPPTTSVCSWRRPT